MYINVQTLQYPVSEPDIRAAFPNTSWPQKFAPPEGFATVQASVQPAHDYTTQRVIEGDPELVNGAWVQTWVVEALAAEQIAANIATEAARRQAAIVAAMDAHFDATAQARQYDNRITCALRAGYPGPFHDEGVAFATWMDNCYAVAHVMLAEVQSGTRPMPTTVGDALALLPAMVWPE